MIDGEPFRAIQFGKRLIKGRFHRQVETAGGLIGHEHTRAADQRPGHQRPLPLAAGERPEIVISHAAEADDRKGPGEPFRLFRSAGADADQAQADELADGGGQRGIGTALLRHEADAGRGGRSRLGTQATPAAGRSRPSIPDNSVVLPCPFGPIRNQNSPLWMRMSTASNTGRES